MRSPNINFKESNLIVDINSKEKYLLLKTVQEKQILPITSLCSLNCLFCSHRQNPPDINVYHFGHLDLKLIAELIDYLPRKGVVTIGESATKIVEGEPLIHPDFKKVITLLRRKFPQKQINLTTAGSFLGDKLLDFLQKQPPLTLNLSLNCSTPRERAKVMADPQPERVFHLLEELECRGFEYHGSITAWPGILKNNSLERAVLLLEKHQAKTVRIFIPGYTAYSAPELKNEISEEWEQKIRKAVTGIQKKLALPVLLEPPQLTDFKIRIQGIIKNSPAREVGLKKFDRITKINSKKMPTRSEAFRVLVEAEDPRITVCRNRTTIADNGSLDGKQSLEQPEVFNTVLKKKSGQKPGLVVHYDLSRQELTELEKIIKQTISRKSAGNNGKNRSKFPAKENSSQKQGVMGVITSRLGSELLHKLLSEICANVPGAVLNDNVRLIVVDNNYFGGNIRSAGLLTTGDILRTLRDRYADTDFKILLIPRVIYGFTGEDLQGIGQQRLMKKTGADLKLI